MLKKILVIILILSFNNYFAFSYLDKNSKNKIDTISDTLFTKIEKNYNISQQKIILIKLDKKINKLKIENKNKNKTQNNEILTYFQNNVKQKIRETVAPVDKSETIDTTMEIQNTKLNITQNSNITTNNGIENNQCNLYYTHSNISASVFWVGEGADASNAYISNAMSAWDGKWEQHFKEGSENLFYVALPYNDFDENGNRRTNAKNIPWYDNNIKSNESVVKNRWIKVEFNGKTAYGQWEDVGPLLENDFDYVFGTGKPKNTFGLKAGIDLSPELANEIGLDGSGNVNWSFVDESCVPQGKWKNTITRNGIFW
ncbi:MAG: hypothetical protein PHS49_06610 [Candidatus Gracilibacteria bacterium]|nr:hypothetical protein [Candidatus Gracilibacteria bacterium]